MTNHQAALQATATLSLILWLKVVATNFGLGLAKMEAGTRAPEDSYQKSTDEASPEAAAQTDRAQRIVNNDLENIPYTMAMAWGAMFCIYVVEDVGVRDTHAIAHIVLYTLFAVGRIGHSILYAAGASIPRTLAFVVGLSSSFAIIINGVVAAFRI